MSTDSELKWIKVYSEAPDDGRNKLLENPFVPIGCLATVGILLSGIYQLYRGDSKKQQTMMRARVISQGLTFAAVGVGYLFFSTKKKTVTEPL